MIEYKFDEDRIIQDIKDYIDATYGEHYADGRIQTNEFIMSHLTSNEGFKLNILKYVTRYGHKDGHNRKDLMKAIHYLIFMLCYHDRKYENKEFDIPQAKPNLVEIPSDAICIPTVFGNAPYPPNDWTYMDDPTDPLSEEDVKDYARNSKSWDDAEDSIERLESKNRLRETRLESAAKKYKKATRFESPGVSIREWD
jgi:hypothetical protein